MSDNGVTLSSSATYIIPNCEGNENTIQGNRLVSTTDAAGNVTTYHYNADTKPMPRAM